MWNQIGNGLAPHGDHHALPRLHALEQVGGFVPQLSCRNFYDSATIVAPGLMGDFGVQS